MDGERVHHRPGQTARAVGGAEILDENGRRVGVAAGSEPVEAARRDRTAADLDRRVNPLQGRVTRHGLEAAELQQVELRLRLGDRACPDVVLGGSDHERGTGRPG
jgi:hypothetical protein